MGILPNWFTGGAAVRRLYFAVRSLALEADAHLLEYGFADESGAVTLEITARSPSPVAAMLQVRSVGSCSAMSAEALDRLAAPLCRGRRLVAFHRVLQAGLLPPASTQAAAGFDCAWRRYREGARRRGLTGAAAGALDLAECLAIAGLAPLAGDSAGARAQAVRALWLWLDAR